MLDVPKACADMKHCFVPLLIAAWTVPDQSCMLTESPFLNFSLCFSKHVLQAVFLDSVNRKQESMKKECVSFLCFTTYNAVLL